VAKLTKSIEIEASPEKVFAFMLDMEKMNEIMKGDQKGEITSDGPVGVGTTLHMVAKVGGSQQESDMEVTEFEKNKKISTRNVGGSKMQVSHILEPTAKGTKLTITYDYELPYSILGKIVDKLMLSRAIEKSTEKELSGIKNALEA
jgi:uncharacterized membrane protein